ncbi:HAD family hydrolase [Catenovulum maritimum]|uniref:Phosphoglycolate phosphatase n=1 Tax=Catenovulum maritimum TaxID=1513271 RepID=A0A0J8GUT1_9ALTE|nr:HAD-IA family hydrolase [Catenovulum maritimum]KMT66520.1 phosphoglycolate phosphatase [Catenovulum maritimum]
MCTKNLVLPKAILFDLDGTLLDTAKDLGETLNYILKQHSKPTVDYQDYRPVASHGALGLLKLGFGDELNRLDKAALRETFLNYYEQNIAVKTDLFDGMEACLELLNKLGIKWGIVTNKPQFLTDKLLPFYNIMSSSQINISGDTLAVKKPDPEPLYVACKHMTLSPEECWYIGDAQRDIEAGNRAGMYTVIANWGYTQDSLPINEWAADLIIETPADLSSLVKTLYEK